MCTAKSSVCNDSRISFLVTVAFQVFQQDGSCCDRAAPAGAIFEAVPSMLTRLSTESAGTQSMMTQFYISTWTWRYLAIDKADLRSRDSLRLFASEAGSTSMKTVADRDKVDLGPEAAPQLQHFDLAFQRSVGVY